MRPKPGCLVQAPTPASDHFIGNEGVPADIPLFDEVRVVLVGEASYQRSWNGGRIFQGMHGEFEIEEKLDTETVRDWLHRIATAP